MKTEIKRETKTTKLGTPDLGRAPAELLFHHSFPAQSWQLATPSPMLRFGGLSPYRPTRREFLIGGGAALLLGAAGCGSNSGSNGGENSGQTRIIDHSEGQVEVPREPSRVVTLIGDAGVDAILTLGIVPVGTAGSQQSGLPIWYEKASYPVQVEPGEIENLGDANQPNLEKIAALEPDVIVGWDYQVEETYEQLSEIAPTVGVSPTNGPEWKESFRGVAEAVGRESEYEEYLESYEQKLRELRSGLSFNPSERTVTVLWNFDDSAIYLYGEPSQPGSIVLDAGFEMPPITDDFYDEISAERLPETDADAIFVMVDEDDIPDDRREFEPTFGDNELWRNLDAVENNRVFPVEIYLWTNGGPSGIRDVMLPELFSAFGQTSG